jgi:DNA invertase Pin-like site-specific DNA recombinase
MGALLGYARVSTLEQNSRLQTDALKSAGCYRVFTDRASGALDERQQRQATTTLLQWSASTGLQLR